MRVSGNLEHLKRSYLIEIIRDVTLPHHTLIEVLIGYGYRQSDYPGESGTYTREGSLIRIWHEDREYTIEYFDDVIESIIEVSPRGRVHRDSILLTRMSIDMTGSSDDREPSIDLSLPLLDLLATEPTLLIGCEFLRERDIIHAKFRDIIEFSTLSREGAARLDMSVPHIESVPEFLEYIGTMGTDGLLSVSRYEKKLREFLDINNYGTIPTLEHRHIQESFCVHGVSAFLGKKWKSYIQNDTLNLLADDIFSKIFVQNRTRKSTIKNLDLLMKLEP